MSLFDKNDMLPKKIAETNFVSRKEGYNKRTKSFYGRATDNEGNTYMYDNNLETGITQLLKIIIPDGNMKEQAKDLYRQGYTQEEIADMLGVSQSTISKLLKK